MESCLDLQEIFSIKKIIKSFIQALVGSFYSAFIYRKKLNKIISQTIALHKTHIFFGYYDICPFSHNNEQILAHKVKKEAKPGKDAADLLLFDLKSGDYKTLNSTDLWCWQMGARLRWTQKNRVLFNKTIDKKYGAVEQDINGKIVDLYPFPIFETSPCQKYGLTLNFNRLEMQRPGYGYAKIKDKFEIQPCPKEDGVFLLDLQHKKSSLLISLESLKNVGFEESMNGSIHYVNHLSFSPDGKTILFFHIWNTKKNVRKTRLIWTEAPFKNIKYLKNKEFVSHVCWKNNNEILVFSKNYNHKPNWSFINLNTCRSNQLNNIFLRQDGHPAKNPTIRNMYVCDTYPNILSFRKLYLVSSKNRERKIIGKYYSPFFLKGEERCDLHPRWSRCGKKIIIDSSHLGFRSIEVIYPKESYWE